MPDSITIHSSWTLDDLDRFRSQAMRRTRDPKPGEGNESFAAMASATAFAVLAGLAAHAVGAVEDIRNPTVALLCGAAFYAGFFLMWGLILRRGDKAWRVAVAPMLERPFTLTIDAQGITLESDGSRKWYAWRRLTAMTDSNTIIVFWLGESEAILLPRRDVSDQEADRVRSFARAGRAETGLKVAQ